MGNYQIPMSRVGGPTLFKDTIVSCKDYYLIDQNNKKYIDFRSGLWNVSLGYNEQLIHRIKIALNEQLEKGMFYLDPHSFQTKLYKQYADRLLSFVNKGSNNYKIVFLTNSGSEGTELVLKIIKKAQISSMKNKILIFEEGYHGTFFGGLSVSGIDNDINMEYQNNKSEVISFPTPTNNKKLNNLIEFIKKEHNKLAAILIEPLVSSGGALQIDDSSLNYLIKLCKSFNILTIFDEVAVGFFRAKSRMYHHRLSEFPDAVILSKTINNGFLPMGSVVIGSELEKNLDGIYLDHFSTQNGNLLGIRSAYETLGYLLEKEEDILMKIQNLEDIWKKYQNKLNISGCGAILAIPLETTQETYRTMNYLCDLGYLVYFYECNTGSGLLLLPPYNLPPKILDDLMKKISELVN